MLLCLLLILRADIDLTSLADLRVEEIRAMFLSRNFKLIGDFLYELWPSQIQPKIKRFTEYSWHYRWFLTPLNMCISGKLCVFSPSLDLELGKKENFPEKEICTTVSIYCFNNSGYFFSFFSLNQLFSTVFCVCVTHSHPLALLQY